MLRIRNALTVLVVAVLLTACGAMPKVQPGGSPEPSAPSPTTPSPIVPANPSPTPAPQATPSPAPPACWPLTGGSQLNRAIITDVRVGTHAGYDRLVIEFSGGMPPFRLEPHDIGTFVGSFRGDPIAVDGNAGLILRLYNQDIPPVFAHGSSLRSGSPELKQVVVLGDFEGQADIGIGLGQLLCPAVSVFGSPTRLVIDFTT
jgi:hypothetical protein